MKLSCLLLLCFCQLSIISLGQFAMEDLKVTTFRNGDSLMFISNEEEWQNAFDNTIPAYCYVNNDPNLGVLYNWAAVHDPRELAPYGWKIPSNTDFEPILADFLNNYKLSYFSNDIRSIFITNPKGYRTYDGGLFLSQGSVSYYWTSTKSDKSRKSYNFIFYVIEGERGGAINGNERRESFCSVRCIQNQNESRDPLGIDGPVSSCKGSTSLLKVSGGSIAPSANWIWYEVSAKGEISKIHEGEALEVTLQNTTDYAVRYEDQDSKTGALVYHRINVHEPPNLPKYIEGALSVCEGSSENYFAVGDKNFGTNWNWFVNGESIGSGRSKDLELSEKNTMISIKASNEFCQSKSVQISVDVLQKSREPYKINKRLDGNEFVLSFEGGRLGDNKAGYEAKWVWYIQKDNNDLKRIGEGSTIMVDKRKSRTYIVRAENGACEGFATKGASIYIQRKAVEVGSWNKKYASSLGRSHFGMQFGLEAFSSLDSIEQQNMNTGIFTPLPLKSHGYGLMVGLNFNPIMNEYFSFGIRGSYSYNFAYINENNTISQFANLTSDERSYKSGKYRLGARMSIGVANRGVVKVLVDYELKRVSNSFRAIDYTNNNSYILRSNRYERLSAGLRIGSYTNQKANIGKNLDLLFTLSQVSQNGIFDFKNSQYRPLKKLLPGFELNFWIHNRMRLNLLGMAPISLGNLSSTEVQLNEWSFEIALSYSFDWFK